MIIENFEYISVIFKNGNGNLLVISTWTCMIFKSLPSNRADFIFVLIFSWVRSSPSLNHSISGSGFPVAGQLSVIDLLSTVVLIIIENNFIWGYLKWNIKPKKNLKYNKNCLNSPIFIFIQHFYSWRYQYNHLIIQTAFTSIILSSATVGAFISRFDSKNKKIIFSLTVFDWALLFVIKLCNLILSTITLVKIEIPSVA